MSYSFYRILHFSGLIMVFMSLGGMLLFALAGGEGKSKAHKWASIFHGIGLLVALVAGFGLIAKIGLGRSGSGLWPSWLFFKLAIWFLLGAAPVLIAKQAGKAKLLWGAIIALGVTASYMANYQPNYFNPAHSEDPNDQEAQYEHGVQGHDNQGGGANDTGSEPDTE